MRGVLWIASACFSAACGRVGFDLARSDAPGTPGDGNGDTIDLVTYREAVLADAPLAYWRFNDTGATAAERRHASWAE